MSNLEKLPWALQRFFQKYFQFSGRANRAEFWWAFVFFGPVTVLVLTCINLSHGLLRQNPFISLFVWLIFIPMLSVKSRRLHDAGKSAWNLLWDFTFLGDFYVLYLLSQPSEIGTNRFGSPVIEPSSDAQALEITNT